jgi:hypothetical protein
MKRFTVGMILVFVLLMTMSCLFSAAPAAQENTAVPTSTTVSLNVTDTLMSQLEQPSDTSIPPTSSLAATSTTNANEPTVRVINGNTGTAIADYSKLANISQEVGVKIVGKGNASSDMGIIYFPVTGASIAKAELTSIDGFVRSGGRAIIFFFPRIWNEENNQIQSLYSISVANDTIESGANLTFNGGDLLPLWDGLTLDVTSTTGNACLGVYFSGNTAQGEVTQIVSKGSNAKRVSSVQLNLGEGSLILASMSADGPVDYGCNTFDFPSGNIFSNDQISLGDNRTAAQKLITWLVSR